MSEVIEDIPTMAPTEYLIEVLKREESSQWEKVDAVRRAVDGDEPSAVAQGAYLGSGGSVNIGRADRIREVWEEIFDADIPERPGISSLARWYKMACFWPQETRVSGASFAAHEALSHHKWRHRQGILSKLVARHSKHLVSRDDVRVWIAEQNKKPVDPWELRFERRVFAPLRSQLAGPQSEGDWKAARDVYRAALNEIEERLAEF